jgi:hypothetical protein
MASGLRMVITPSVHTTAGRAGANAGTFGVRMALPLVTAVVVLTVMSSVWPGWQGSSLPTAAGTGLQPSTSTGIQILPLSSATPISPEFWGINVEATEPFTVSDAQALATTPVTVIKYPGGVTADGMNYTTGVATSNKTGAMTHVVTPPSAFIKSCEAIGCHAMLVLPAEIANPATDAYDVSYVEHTLGFTPAYWEIGDTPSAWNHYDQPWSSWAKAPTSRVTIAEYTALLERITAAVRAVDPRTPLIAPAIGQGFENGITTCSTWCGPVVAADGASLAAVSVHSYVAYLVPASTSVQSYFARLTTSAFALPTIVRDDRADIAHNYSGTIPLYLDEVAIVNSFDGIQATFGTYSKTLDGGLFEAAEVTQSLAMGVGNIDWFDWSDSAGFGWYAPRSGTFSPIGQVFHTFMTQLYGKYDPTTALGPSTLFAAATTDGTNLSLLVVNTNTTAPFSFPLSTLFSGTVDETSWAYGSSITSGRVANTTVTAPPLSVSVWRGLGHGSHSALPAITVSPTRGPVGASVTVSGAGFSESTKLKSVVFDSKTITSCSSGSLMTTAAGAFSCTIKVPSGASGTKVTATNVGGQTATSKFTVTTPKITVAPAKGPVGSTVTVSGTGFSVSSKIGLVFDGVKITTCTKGSLTTSGMGAFSCTFKVTSGTSGTTVKATDPGGKMASAKFTVT